MAKTADRQTGYLLGIFLLSLAVLVLAAFSWQLHRKNLALQQEVKQLQDSQVVLMVPDAQAEKIADWMVKHPEQTASLLDVVKPVQEGKMSLQQSLDNAKQQPSASDSKPEQTKVPTQRSPAERHNNIRSAPTVPTSLNSPVIVEQLKDGVKVIRLPHGGIRVTTRDVKDQ